MTRKTKKVTVEQEVYIACDGTEFEDEDDCIAYEVELTEAKFEMYNHLLHKVDSISECYYVCLNSADNVNQFIDCCKYYGITTNGIRRPAIYAYDDRDSWINLNSVMFAFGINLEEVE